MLSFYVARSCGLVLSYWLTRSLDLVLFTLRDSLPHCGALNNDGSLARYGALISRGLAPSHPFARCAWCSLLIWLALLEWCPPALVARSADMALS